MPSSPEAVAAVAGRVDFAHWEPADLKTAVGDGARIAPPQPRPERTRAASSAFDRLFPTVAAAPAPEPFVVSSRSGIPDAVLAEARKVAQSVGYAEGFANGMAEARSRALAEATAERARVELVATQARVTVARATGALLNASDELSRREARTLADVEDLIVSAALDVAAAVVGARLHDEPRWGATAALARALALVPQGARQVTVRLHPADHQLISTLHADDGVRFVADAGLHPGDAVAVTDTTTIDARISAGLDRAREVLAR